MRNFDPDSSYIQGAKTLPWGEPPSVWTGHTTVAAAGVFAGGWEEDYFWLLSYSGYSRTHVYSGQVNFTEMIYEDLMQYLDFHTTVFTVPQTGQVVRLFGLHSGDGLFSTADGWHLEYIYPFWPYTDIVIFNSKEAMSLGYNLLPHNRWIGRVRLKLPMLELAAWLKCGFSSNGNMFVVMGEPGAEIYYR